MKCYTTDLKTAAKPVTALASTIEATEKLFEHRINEIDNDFSIHPARVNGLKIEAANEAKRAIVDAEANANNSIKQSTKLDLPKVNDSTAQERQRVDPPMI